jgi:hypothetical protein
LNQFCGDVVDGRSEGEGSDLCDLQAVPRKKKIMQNKRKVARTVHNKKRITNERNFLEL